MVLVMLLSRINDCEGSLVLVVVFVLLLGLNSCCPLMFTVGLCRLVLWLIA